jgi:hypothetical protein
MIVVAGRLDRPLIEGVLRDLDASGELDQCSRSLEEGLAMRKPRDNQQLQRTVIRHRGVAIVHLRRA